MNYPKLGLRSKAEETPRTGVQRLSSFQIGYDVGTLVEVPWEGISDEDLSGAVAGPWHESSISPLYHDSGNLRADRLAVHRKGQLAAELWNFLFLN